jgi:hypothetical protein
VTRAKLLLNAGDIDWCAAGNTPRCRSFNKLQRIVAKKAIAATGTIQAILLIMGLLQRPDHARHAQKSTEAHPAAA